MPKIQKVKILFYLEQDSDGYPPETIESCWANDLGDNQFEINNIPFFIKNLSLGDIVKTVTQPDGMLEYSNTVKHSKNSTIRIIFHEQNQITIALNHLNSLGVSYEGSHIPNLYAFNIPESADIESLLKYLDTGENSDLWGYEISASRWG